MLISSCLMLGAALVINNLHRHYPAYWWSPAPVGRLLTKQHPDVLEKKKKSRTPTVRERDPEVAVAGLAGEANPEAEDVEAGSVGTGDEKEEVEEQERVQSINVTARGLEVPEDLHLAEDEEATLRVLQQRLERGWRVRSAERT